MQEGLVSEGSQASTEASPAFNVKWRGNRIKDLDPDEVKAAIRSLHESASLGMFSSAGDQSQTLRDLYERWDVLQPIAEA